MPQVSSDQLTVKHHNTDTAAAEIHQKTSGVTNVDALVVRQWGTSGSGRGLVVRSDNTGAVVAYIEGNTTITGDLDVDGAFTPGSLALTGAASSTDVLTSKVTGDAVSRFVLNAGGGMDLGNGTDAVDTNLYRTDANILRTDDSLQVGTNLSVTGTSALGAAATVTVGAAGTTVIGSLVTNDTFDRFRVLASGAHEWGAGSGARDTGLSRGAANRLDVTTANLRIATAGRGLQVAEGSNAKMGTLTLNGATPVVVSTTAVTANSRIFLTTNTVGGTPGFHWVSDRTADTSFSVTGTAGDTSVVAWLIIEPA